MSDWTNKIVGHDEVDPALLVANDKKIGRASCRERV